MTGKAKMSAQTDRSSEKQKGGKKKNAKKKDVIVVNPPHGEKGHFIKLTVTLPPEVYELIAKEVTRRKMNKEPNPQISAVIREAVVAQLKD